MRHDPIDRSPAQLSATLSIVAALIAVLASALVSPIGGAVGGPGLLVLLLGLTRGSRRAVTIGSFVIFLGVLAGGAIGADTPAVLVAVVAVVLGWDWGENAINVGEQLGREADTRSGELAHAASSLLIGAGAAALGYVLYVTASGQKPLTALVLLLFAAIVLTSSFRD